MISQEQLKIEVKLLLSANGKSYMPPRLAQQRMTLSGFEWPFHASRAISVVAELLVAFAQPKSRQIYPNICSFFKTNFFGRLGSMAPWPPWIRQQQQLV